MENPISISKLNDFVFCPISIYFHNLYMPLENKTYQDTYQTNGAHIHQSTDTGTYSNSKNVLQAIDIYSEKYNLYGKIDVFDAKKGILIERKKKVKTIYDGYVFQLYAEYFALVEMGYKVNELCLYSYDDNKKHKIPLPQNNIEMFKRFNNIINELKVFDFNSFVQSNPEKCLNCIYEPYCDRSIGVL